MNRVKWWKLFQLPSPSDLGWTDSKYNALPMRMFKNRADDTPTWEDWEEKMEKEYPVRYFLSESLPRWYRAHIHRRVKDTLYWVKCKVLPSHKYHILDLRQPANVEHKQRGYKYGWIDSDTKLLYAMFNILNIFVEKEMPEWYCPSEEEVQKDTHLAYQRNNWLETKAIHYWWNVERPRQMAVHDDLLHRWSEARSVDAPETHELWNELQKMDSAQVEKEDEMIDRLMKVRRSLWT